MILCLGAKYYAPVAQLVEHLTFNQGVRSSHTARGILRNADSLSPLLSSRNVLISPTPRSKFSAVYCDSTQYAPVAQLVEHLTFNQGVRSSILRRSTKGLTNQSLLYLDLSLFKLNIFRDVAQLVARLLWEQDVAGSNPVIPTKKVVSF